MFQKRMALILITIIFVSLFAGCINNEDKHLEYLFEVKMVSSTSNETYLLIPFPVDDKNDIPLMEIIEQMEIIGNGDAELEITDHGHYLNISFKQNLKLRTQIKKDWESSFGRIEVSIAKKNYTDLQWIFSKDSNIQLDYEFKAIFGTGRVRHYLFNGPIEEGWQLVTFENQGRVV